jgi:NADP-reducing hydrogenase subunit HndB
MTKIKDLEELKQMRDQLLSKIDLREKGEFPEGRIQIKVAMSTCGIEAGAKAVLNSFIEELDKRSISAIVMQTDCLGYCKAEPTVEISLPDHEAIVFGFVDSEKVVEIIEQYIIKNELVDGVITPSQYEIINNNGIGGRVNG